MCLPAILCGQAYLWLLLSLLLSLTWVVSVFSWLLMKESFNPYEAGQSHLIAGDGGGDAIKGVPVSEKAMGKMFATRVWVVIVLVGLVVNLGLNLYEIYVSVSVAGGYFFQEELIGVFVSVVFGVIMTVFVARYCKALGRFKERATEESFERVVVTQSKVWRVFGVLLLSCIVFILMMMMVGLILAFRV